MADGTGRAVVMTVEQVRALQLGVRMAATAGEVMRGGGYPQPAAALAAVITGAMADAAQALSRHLGTLDPATVTDDEIDAAADGVAVAIIREALGPAPMAH
jgi:hypothetical protein